MADAPLPGPGSHNVSGQQYSSYLPRLLAQGPRNVPILPSERGHRDYFLRYSGITWDGRATASQTQTRPLHLDSPIGYPGRYSRLSITQRGVPVWTGIRS